MFMLIVFGFTVPDRSGLFRILVPPGREQQLQAGSCDQERRKPTLTSNYYYVA